MKTTGIRTTSSSNQRDRQKLLKELKHHPYGTCFSCGQPVEIPGTDGFRCSSQTCGSQGWVQLLGEERKPKTPETLKKMLNSEVQPQNTLF